MTADDVMLQVEKLEIKEGDTLVIRISKEDNIPPDVVFKLRQNISNALKEKLKFDIPVLMFKIDVELEVVSPEQKEVFVRKVIAQILGDEYELKKKE